MTGVFGGATETASLRRLADASWTEPWYVEERCERGPFGLVAVHHGSRDPAGCDVWRDDRRMGVLFGAVTNRAALGLEGDALFEQVLSEPASTLARLDGPFALVCVDAAADHVVLAVDKLGARQLFYTASDPFVFGTAVSPLLTHVDDPSVDHRGVSDLLTIGQVWGDRTLVEEVRSLPSGSVLEYRDGDVSVEPYRTFSFDRTGAAYYVEGVVDRYREAVKRTAETVEGDVGLWLSGGADSRALGGALDEVDSLAATYTYDANPPKRNCSSAAETASRLGVPNRQLPIDGVTVADRLDDIVSLVDGLVPWNSGCNLVPTFDIDDDLAVVLEASGQGVLLGSGIWQADARMGTDAADILYRGEHHLGAETTRRLLDIDVDPMASYREAVADANGHDDLSRALAALHRYYLQRGDFTSNRISRTRTGTRVPYVDEALVSHLERMPTRLRERTFPFTKGAVPYGCAPLKLELVRRISPELADIPYSRSGIPMSRPLWMHAAGFVLTTANAFVRSRPTHGSKTLVDVWYRTTPDLREYVDGLLDDAKSRAIFDAEALEQLRTEQLAGDAHNAPELACVTTAERWLQRHVKGY